MDWIIALGESETVQTVLITAIVGFITWIVGLIGRAARRYLGDRSTEILRKVLAEAIGNYLDGSPGAGVSSALTYLRGTIPETLERLGVTDDQVASRVMIEQARRDPALTLNQRDKSPPLPK